MLTRAAWGLSLLALAASGGLALASACGNDYTVDNADAGDVGDSSPPRDDAAPEAAADASPDAGPRCDPAKAFGAPVLVTKLSTPVLEVGARLAAGETLVFFTRANSLSDYAHTFLAVRATASGDFSESAQDPVLNTPTSGSYNPSPTRDGLTVYFLSTRDAPGTLGLFVATRASLVTTFTTITKIATVPADIAQPSVTASGSALYYTTGFKIVRSPIVSGAVGAPVDVGLPMDAATPSVSPDELTLYFSLLKNAPNDWDVFMATRASTADSFGSYAPIDAVNTTAEDRPNWISEDGCELWLTSKIVLDGGTDLGDIYVARKPL
jgi:hypothetical protein